MPIRASHVLHLAGFEREREIRTGEKAVLIPDRAETGKIQTELAIDKTDSQLRIFLLTGGAEVRILLCVVKKEMPP